MPKKNLLSIISLCFLLIQVPIRSKHFPPAANLQGFGPIIVELPREEHRHASSWLRFTGARMGGGILEVFQSNTCRNLD